MRKVYAIVRAVYHINPATLTIDELAELYAEANYYMHAQAVLNGIEYAKIFTGKNT